MNEKLNKIEKIKVKVVDFALLTFFITFLPIMVLNVFRSNATGWTILSFVFPFIQSGFLVTYLLKNILHFEIKKGILVFGLMTIGFLTYISNGMLGLGGMIFGVVVAVVTFTSNKLYVGIVFAITVLLIVITRVLITQNIVEVEIDVAEFFYSPIAWTGQLIGYITLTIVLIAMIIVEVTDSNQLTKEYVKEVSELKSIINHINSPIILVDQYKNIRFLNDTFGMVIQRDVNDFIGKTLSSLFSLEIFKDLTTQIEIKKQLEETLKTKKPSSLILKFIIQNELREFLCNFDTFYYEEDDFEIVVIGASELVK